MVHKILMLLSYGRKIEKYARSAQAVSKAFKMLHDDLNEIWGDKKKEVESKKVLESAKETDKEGK
ncbi:hypothetical protein [Flagellimonas sp. 2504JD4-2]